MLNDLIGKTFGRLTVKDISTPRRYNKNIQQMLECVCSCGADNVIVQKTHLKNGYVKSCGCLWREQIKKGRDMKIVADKQKIIDNKTLLPLSVVQEFIKANKIKKITENTGLDYKTIRSVRDAKMCDLNINSSSVDKIAKMILEERNA